MMTVSVRASAEAVRTLFNELLVISRDMILSQEILRFRVPKIKKYLFFRKFRVSENENAAIDYNDNFFLRSSINEFWLSRFG